MNAVQITFGKEMNYKMPISQEGHVGKMIPETVRPNMQPEMYQCKGPKPEEVAKKTGGWNMTRPGHRKSK